MDIYKHPLYYEIAFSGFDVKKQVDCFEHVIEKFSKIKVKRVLDIACGPSLQLREIARRGYEAVGLDLSEEMLEYLQKRAKEEGVDIECIQADDTDFRLKRRADFAFIMMGSFGFKSNEDLLRHLDSVAASLKKGGLYFIQNLGLDWIHLEKEEWTAERGGVIVKSIFETHVKNVIAQIITERGVLEVDDHGKKMVFEDEEDLKMVAPQEFKLLVTLNGKFEFLGWWRGSVDSWNLAKPLENSVEDLDYNMVLLRRR